MHKIATQSLYCLFAFGLSTSLSLTGCSNDKDGKDGKDGKNQNTTTHGFVDAATKPRVIGLDGNPLAKVKVLIGDSLNSPFNNNFIETDVDGTFTVPAGWTESQAITLDAPGYVRATYLKQKPIGQSFTLRPSEKARGFELAGPTTGFQVVNKDGIADFGLVIPSLSRKDLFSFDVGMVVSSQLDDISILGQTVSLPSNITLPTQKETYIFPLTLDKPNYRMYFSSKGPKQVFTGRGQFPLKPVIDEMRAGKTFFELANYFKINGGSLKEIELKGEKTNASLPVQELNFNQTREFKAPIFDNDQMVISLALSSYQGNLFPTDFKNVPSNQTTKLTTALGEKPFLLSVLKKRSESEGYGADRVSATLLPFDNGISPQMLPMMKDPQVIALNHLKADMINSINGVTPVGSYMVLSAVEDRVSGGYKSQILNKLWEIYETDWSPEYTLPIWPGGNLPKGKMRWEVSRTGTLQKLAQDVKILDLGPSLFDSVTHATHSSVDFQ